MEKGSSKTETLVKDAAEEKNSNDKRLTEAYTDTYIYIYIYIYIYTHIYIYDMI